LRSTLDVFDEYSDSDIYEALRRVHLLKADDVGVAAGSSSSDDDERNKNVFKNLDSLVRSVLPRTFDWMIRADLSSAIHSEGGENFS
jgi:hypothetical protein